MPLALSRKTKATALRAPWPTVWIRKTSGGRGFLGLLGFLLRALGCLVARGGRLGVGAVEQRHQRKGRGVGPAGGHLPDAQVAAVPLWVARPRGGEQLSDDRAGAQPVVGQGAVGERGV